MKINRTAIIARLSNSPKLTYNVLWNLIDHFAEPDGWWHWLLKYDTDRVRPLVVKQAIRELGLRLTLRTVADCYRYHIA